MPVVCTSCQVPVLTEDVNVVRVVAKCRACGAVFSFDDQLGGPPMVDAPRAPVRHGPIPAGNSRDVPLQEVRQLYVEEIVSSKGAKSYNVQIVLTTGPTLTLVTELQSPLQARFLEQTVEEHLRLPDEPMPRSSPG